MARDRGLTATQITVAQHMQAILMALGQDLRDENFEETPERYAQWITEFVERPDTELYDILSVSFPTAPGSASELIAVTNIAFTALCAHHMLPFRGVAHVAYIPGEGRGVVGISKLARVVTHFAHRLTMQERITQQIADALIKHLEPLGVMVVIRSAHQCMGIRGVRDPHAVTITSAVRGVFKDPSKGARQEFLALLPRTNEADWG